MHVRSLDDALAVYFEAAGDTPIQPASGTEYDQELGGWLFENANRPLALVLDDGTLVEPEYDSETGEWVIPR
jgi:hypothetical protein